MIFLLFALQLFIPAPLAQRTLETISEGSWESCPMNDGSGDYAEKALDYSVKGHPWFEIHYGPRDEFAIFAGNTPDHIEHTDARNLLKPAFHFEDIESRTGRNWSIASLGIHLNVVRIDGGGADCYSFFTKIERDPRPTWAKQ